MSEQVRIGAVSYLNTLPLVHGLKQGHGSERIDLSYGTPAELARRMRDGALDIALLPVIELARIPDLELVPGLGIVTHGDSRSVLLVSGPPPERIESLALDPESRTSNVLARVLLDRVWSCRPAAVRMGSVDLDADLRDCDAVVRIGDKALFEPVPPGAKVYDLGRVWTDHTGQPFVFAGWAARAGTLDRETYRALHDSRRRGSRAIEAIAEDYRWRGTAHPKIAREYLTHNIRFRLGRDEIRAIESFFRAVESLRLIDRVPPIRLALERWSSCHETAAQSR